MGILTETALTHVDDAGAADERFFPEHGGVYPGWRVVFVSVLAMVVGPPSVLILSFGLFIPEFHAAFGWSVQAISLGATIMSLMLIAIAPLQGFLADRTGCRPLILISIPLFAAGLVAMSRLGPAIGFFYLACVLMPFAGLGLWPLTYMKMASTWFDRRLGLALGFLNLGNGLGGALMPLLLGVIFGLYGWRTALVTLACVNLVVAWPIAIIWLNERPEQFAKPVDKKQYAAPREGLTAAQAIRSRTFIVIASGFFVIGVLSSGFVVHLFNILVEAGASKRHATIMQSYLGVSSIVGRLAAGWLMDRVAAGRVLAGLLAMVALVVGLYSAVLAGPLTVVCVTVVGLMIGGEMNILGFLIKRYFGEHSFGTLYGLVFAVFATGGALGPQLLAMSRSYLHSYAPGLATVAGACLLVSLPFLWLGPYRYPSVPRHS